MLSRNASNKVRHTAPRTYMSAAGLQSEIDPKTLAQLALHDTQYKHVIAGYRTDVERKVTNISKEQKVIHKSMVAYRRKKKAIAKAKKKEKPSLVASHLPSEATVYTAETIPLSSRQTVSRRTSAAESSTPVSSTRVNIGTPSGILNGLRRENTSIECFDALPDMLEAQGMILTRNEMHIPEHHVLTKEDVILEESEPSDSDDSEEIIDTGQVQKEMEEVANEQNDEDELTDIDNTPRSKVSEVSVNGLKLQVPRSNTLEDKGMFVSPRSKPKQKKETLEASMSFMKLVRLQQSSGLSKNLSLVDQLTKKIQPKKLPHISDDDKTGEVSKILGGGRGLKEKSILYGRDTQSDTVHQTLRAKVHVAIRGHSDTKGSVSNRHTKEVTPFKRVTNQVDQHKNKNSIDLLTQTPERTKESSLISTKTWIHNSALIDDAELPTENTFLSDTFEGDVTQRGNSTTPRGILVTPRGLPGQLIKNEPMLNSAKGDTSPANVERSLTSILGPQYRRSNTRVSGRRGNQLDALPLSRQGSNIDLDEKTAAWPTPRRLDEIQTTHHMDTSPGHTESPRRQHEDNKNKHNTEALLAKMPLEAKDYRKKEKFHMKNSEKDLKQFLRDERKALEKEDLMNNDIKWRRKLARVKEVHFLGSGDAT